MSRSRGWCFTLNNYDATDYQSLADIFNKGKCEYLIMGKEVAPETGTHHLQGFLYFKNAKTFAAAKGLLGSRAHVEASKGNIEQNYAYCSKGGNFGTWGTRPMSQTEKGEANRVRYEKAWELAKVGDFESIDGDIRLNSYRTLKEIHKDYMPRVDDSSDVTGYWLFGEAGVGKSRTARERFPVFYPKLANKWWDGYQGEKAVILDDLDPDNAKYIAGHLKLWSDRYSFLAETKGGAKRIRPEYFVVTSQYSIAECFSDDKVVAALGRRFKQERIFQYIQSDSWLPVDVPGTPNAPCGEDVPIALDCCSAVDLLDSDVSSDYDSDCETLVSEVSRKRKSCKMSGNAADRLRAEFEAESSDDESVDIR